MPITTGIDIVHVQRMKKIIEERGRTFLTRVFTKDEIAYCDKKASKFQHYAARFAAKEAFLKALPETNARLTYKNIEVQKVKNAPVIRVVKVNKKRIRKPKSMSVSIAHEREFAVAVVVLEYR